MSDQALRSSLIRLAYTKPELRSTLLHLLAGTGAGKKAAAGIPVTLKREFKLKDGTVLQAGEKGKLRFDAAKPGLAIIDFDSRPNTRLGTRYLWEIFGRPFTKAPTMSALEKMSDGMAKSVTGKTVEPDGYGPDGSPSWLLVLGFI